MKRLFQLLTISVSAAVLPHQPGLEPTATPPPPAQNQAGPFADFGYSAGDLRWSGSHSTPELPFVAPSPAGPSGQAPQYSSHSGPHRFVPLPVSPETFRGAQNWISALSESDSGDSATLPDAPSTVASGPSPSSLPKLAHAFSPGGSGGSGGGFHSFGGPGGQKQNSSSPNSPVGDSVSVDDLVTNIDPPSLLETGINDTFPPNDNNNTQSFLVDTYETVPNDDGKNSFSDFTGLPSPSGDDSRQRQSVPVPEAGATWLLLSIALLFVAQSWRYVRRRHAVPLQTSVG